jgi:probable HAF family extracellular repeat protein
MFLRSANVLSRVLGFLPRHRRHDRGRPAPRKARLAVVALEERCLLSSYSITDIGAINSPSAINSATLTQVAGTAAAAPGAYIWDSIHGLQQIGTLNHETSSVATSINNAGQVVGFSSSTTEKYDKKTHQYYYIVTENAFLWSSSAGMTNLGSNMVPRAVNDSGQVVGDPPAIDAGTQALLWNGKSWIPLGILPGGTLSEPFGINDYGQVVGLSRNGNNSFYEAFLWTPSSPNATSGSMIDLGSFMSLGSNAVAISRQGWVTGFSNVPLSQPIGDTIGVGHAFLWKPASANGTTGTMIDLGTLDPKAKARRWRTTAAVWSWASPTRPGPPRSLRAMPSSGSRARTAVTR